MQADRESRTPAGFAFHIDPPVSDVFQLKPGDMLGRRDFSFWWLQKKKIGV
jgi:hypothetical protein